MAARDIRLRYLDWDSIVDDIVVPWVRVIKKDLGMSLIGFDKKPLEQHSSSGSILAYI
jgi:hypothetical protein